MSDFGSFINVLNTIGQFQQQQQQQQQPGLQRGAQQAQQVSAEGFVPSQQQPGVQQNFQQGAQSQQLTPEQLQQPLEFNRTPIPAAEQNFVPIPAQSRGGVVTQLAPQPLPQQAAERLAPQPFQPLPQRGSAAPRSLAQRPQDNIPLAGGRRQEFQQQQERDPFMEALTRTRPGGF